MKTRFKFTEKGMRLARKIASERTGLHLRHASRRPLSEDYELVGVMGEMAFEGATGLPMDRERKPGGDKGIDFTAPGITIDVKSAQKPGHLLVEENKVVAGYYVLAGVYLNGDWHGEVDLIGWDYGKIMEKCQKDDFGAGIITHYKYHGYLRSMQELEIILQKSIDKT